MRDVCLGCGVAARAEHQCAGPRRPDRGCGATPRSARRNMQRGQRTRAGADRSHVGALWRPGRERPGSGVRCRRYLQRQRPSSRPNRWTSSTPPICASYGEVSRRCRYRVALCRSGDDRDARRLVGSQDGCGGRADRCRDGATGAAAAESPDPHRPQSLPDPCGRRVAGAAARRGRGGPARRAGAAIAAPAPHARAHLRARRAIRRRGAGQPERAASRSRADRDREGPALRDRQELGRPQPALPLVRRADGRARRSWRWTPPAASPSAPPRARACTPNTGATCRR